MSVLSKTHREGRRRRRSQGVFGGFNVTSWVVGGTGSEESFSS
jgi:hypothetical protein